MANVLKDESIQQVNIIELTGAAGEMSFDATAKRSWAALKCFCALRLDGGF